MTENTKELKRKNRGKMIVKAYPFSVLLVSTLLNLFAFRVSPLAVTLPSVNCIRAVIISAVLLVINHTWLMTSTELTRSDFNLYASPEEWAKSGKSPQDVSEKGVQELNRRHNAHRNTTENLVYFVLLVAAFVVASPTTIAAQVWIIGFAAARLGYTYSYLSGKDDLRGLFMSLGLLSMYGLTSYLVISLFV